tara:strand:+ start:1529 stop:1705 length:177 start_codon:yes stop_codon:yes gene_type:complete
MGWQSEYHPVDKTLEHTALQFGQMGSTYGKASVITVAAASKYEAYDLSGVNKPRRSEQ